MSNTKTITKEDIFDILVEFSDNKSETKDSFSFSIDRMLCASESIFRVDNVDTKTTPETAEDVLKKYITIWSGTVGTSPWPSYPHISEEPKRIIRVMQLYADQVTAALREETESEINYVKHGASEMQKFLTDQNKALEKQVKEYREALQDARIDLRFWRVELVQIAIETVLDKYTPKDKESDKEPG